MPPTDGAEPPSNVGEVSGNGETAEVLTLDDKGRGRAPGFPPVPFAAPGDTVTLGEAGPNLRPISRHRQSPACPLFQRCGGCSLQHLSDDAYVVFKADRVTRALRGAGLSAPTAPLQRSPLASRRRATFTIVRQGKGIVFGYRAARSHDVVEVSHCPVLAPALDAALPALRAIGEHALKGAPALRLTATLCDNGIDVALAPEKPRGREKVAPAPAVPLPDESIARISWRGETLIARDAPDIRFPGGTVSPPPGAFLQATREGERALIDLVTSATEGARRVADLFCGVGTFALPLARSAQVLAVEGDGAALAALSGARRPRGAKPLETRRRDLMKHPLSPQELGAFDAVVFDPPRAGAEGQARALAGSDVETIVAVSCEPTTLARDCAILAAAGYKITQVTPVDQFVATAHIETVAVLRRRE